MAKADDIDSGDEVVVADQGAGLAGALIILTGVMLLVAIYIVLHLLDVQYGRGLLAG